MDRETRRRLRAASEGTPEPATQPAAQVPAELAGFVSDEIECPFCAEKIKAKAKVCKHCDRDLAEPESRDKKGAKSGKRPSERTAVVHHHHHGATVTKSPGTAAVLALLLPGVGHIYAGRIAAGLAFIFVLPIGFTVASFLLLGAAAVSGSAAGVGAAYLLLVGLALAIYVFQIYDAYNSCASGARVRALRRGRR